MEPIHYSKDELIQLLGRHGINTTAQRIDIARVLFAHGDHVSAEVVFDRVNRELSDARRVSKATVYNTLGLFADKGLIRQVIADPTRVFYDPNTQPHHHFYDVDNHRLTDIDVSDIEMQGLPALPEGATLEGVDVVIRVRHH
jgi:Fur family iron response transcriptional regulator